MHTSIFGLSPKVRHGTSFVLGRRHCAASVQASRADLSLPLRADWAHWCDSLTPTFIMGCAESFEIPLLPGNRLLNILLTRKVAESL